jgi:hypothetical protein
MANASDERSIEGRGSMSHHEGTKKPAAKKSAKKSAKKK